MNGARCLAINQPIHVGWNISITQGHMSYKNISIPLALICCVFLFNAFDIATFIGELKIKFAHNLGSSPKKNTGRVSLVHSVPVTLKTDKEIPYTDALNERETALSGDQSLRPENMTLNNFSTISDRKDRSGNSYTIEKGDTPDSIAAKHGISLRELLLSNKKINSKNLKVGQTLSIPGKNMVTAIKIKAILGKRFSIDKSQPTTKIAAKDTKKYKNLIEQTSSNNNWDDEISSSFGRRTDPIDDRSKFHKGIDIPRPLGTKVFAWDGGVVTRAGWLRGYGLTVDVVHSNGIKTRYAHLTKVNVRKGQNLNEGQILGKVGKTGRTTGANLHFEVLLAGKQTDPRKYLSEGLEIVEDIRENG